MKLIIWFALLGLIFTSISVHEFVHYIQYNGEVKEICGLGFYEGEKGSWDGAGWVTPKKDINKTTFQIEWPAYTIQFIYLLIVFWLLLRSWKKGEGYK